MTLTKPVLTQDFSDHEPLAATAGRPAVRSLTAQRAYLAVVTADAGLTDAGPTDTGTTNTATSGAEVAGAATTSAAITGATTTGAAALKDGARPGPVTPRARSLGHTPIWEPVASKPSPRAPALPTTSEVLARTVAPDRLPPELEHAMLAVLTRPLAAGESHQTGNDHRERELCALIATLDLAQAHHLGRRLDLERATDALAQAFRRMVIDRRQRVRTFVAGARRRQMLRATH